MKHWRSKQEIVMSKIIFSLAAVALLGTICIATASNRPVASALAQAEGYVTSDTIVGMDEATAQKYVSLVGP
jgi:hypothetical protein